MDVHGFNIINLIIPGESEQMTLRGKHGDWTLTRVPDYIKMREAVETRVKAAVTYTADHPDVGFSDTDDLFDEILHICLSASFLTSNTVTIHGSTSYSKTTMMNLTPDIFPREKGASGFIPAVATTSDFKQSMEVMLGSFDANKTLHHTDFIMHYWLEVLSCWSLENMFLSACTILELLKQSERRRTSSPNMYFYDAIVSLSTHHGLTVLSSDWKNMRNDLVHEGQLSKNHFPGKSKADCIAVCEDVMDWIDQFMFKVHGIASPRIPRFGRGSLVELNSYTTT
jgi:hypothetical protein